MSVWRLIRKEILHRKLNFALGILSVLVAVGVVVAQFTLLRAHDLRTEELLHHKQAEAEERLARLEDDYRKYMKELGFNLLILPADQDLTEYWEKGYATATMPEENVAKLARSGTTLIRHLLPIVQQNVFWKERKRRIILIGTRGEVPQAHRGPKEPMLLAVPEGKVVVGYQLASDLGLKAGKTISLLGRDFVIHKCRPYRGSAEDATIWMDLRAGQELLKMPGRLNAIEALKCKCKGVTTEQLRKEVAGYLENTVKVVVRENEVTVRAKARDRARAEHAGAIAAEKAGRAKLRSTRESFAAVLVPLVLGGSAVWIGFLALSNVRERTAEIGILRAIGVRSGHIFAVFLVKALVIGLLGSVAGYVAGLAASMAAARITPSLRVEAVGDLFAPGMLVAAVVAAPVLAMLASWAPATVASRQDPAVILSKE
ncbi:MAG TPA: FtsX-like permease family protein [Phycisphaerae bacterium]|nr:FtsX-like permease family protein [Phycisphaerae bacterium]